MAEQTTLIIERIARYASRVEETDDGIAAPPSITIPDEDVVQLAVELAQHFFATEPRKQLMNLVNSVGENSANLEHLKRALSGTYVYGVRLEFEARINGAAKKLSPNTLLNTHRLASGLEFFRYANGRIGIRFGDTWLDDIDQVDWESLVTAMGELHEKSA